VGVPAPSAEGWYQAEPVALAEPAAPSNTSPPGFDEPTESSGPVRPPSPRSRPAEKDSSGNALAMRLPEWDLLPPTEFVQRSRGR